MKIELLGVLQSEGAELAIDEKVDLSGLKLSDGGPEFSEPVSVKAKIVNLGDTLDMKGEIAGDFHVLCARCTKELAETFCFPFEETLMPLRENQPEISEGDAIVFSGTSVDITDIVTGNILVNLSLKYLCREDCKGLCPICGADLNVAPCHCKTEEIDPRLSVLKNLLDD